MASYPGAIPAKPSINTSDMSAATAHTVDRGLLWDELRAALTELGLTPSGAFSTVKARLDGTAATITAAAGSDPTLAARLDRLDSAAVGGVVDGTQTTTVGTTQLTIASTAVAPTKPGKVTVWACTEWTQTVGGDIFRAYLQVPPFGGNFGRAAGGAGRSVVVIGQYDADGSTSYTLNLVLVRASGTGTATNEIADGATQIIWSFQPDN